METTGLAVMVQNAIAYSLEIEDKDGNKLWSTTYPMGTKLVLETCTNFANFKSSRSL